MTEWRNGCGCDGTIYKQHNIVERIFCRFMDWRRIHAHYDRCAHTFLSAISFAAAFLLWLNQEVLALAACW